MTGSGTLNDPFIIYDATDLQAIEDNLSDYYELAFDIDASVTSGWNGGLGFDPIINFDGNLDGKGYSISDLFINRPLEDDVGLIGASGNGLTISNLTLIDVDITGKDLVGSLIGISSKNDTVSNCKTSGSITGDDDIGGFLGWAGALVSERATFTDCSTSCLVTSVSTAPFAGQIGGFVGYSLHTDYTRCFAIGNVIGSADCQEVGGFVGNQATSGEYNKCFATGAVSTGDDGGDSYCGGFVGTANGGFTDCYARGAVTATGEYVGGFAGVSDDEDNCYSTGAVTGVGANVGGFNGNEGGTTTECFWDTDTSGQAASAGAETGKTTSQMKDAATFTAWALSTIWNLVSTCNDGYPCLIDVNACCLVSVSNQVDQTIVGTKVVLEGIRNLEMQYGGKFFISKSGDALWQSRYHRNV